MWPGLWVQCKAAASQCKKALTPLTQGQVVHGLLADVEVLQGVTQNIQSMHHTSLPAHLALLI